MDLPKEFFELHKDIPREGPGSDESTLKAASLLPPLPPDAAVVDMGCGPGKQTMLLAKTLGVRVFGLDIHQQYLDQLERDSEIQDVKRLIETRRADMAEPGFAPESLDLIWSEGAIYIIGLANGLRAWKPLLKPGGLLAFSEIVWTSDNPPDEIREYMHAEGAVVTSVQRVLDTAAAEGFEIIGHFLLPPSDWWVDYYRPLEERIEKLRPGANDVLKEVIAMTEHELEMHRRYGEHYSYVFVVLRKP